MFPVGDSNAARKESRVSLMGPCSNPRYTQIRMLTSVAAGAFGYKGNVLNGTPTANTKGVAHIPCTNGSWSHAWSKGRKP